MIERPAEIVFGKCLLGQRLDVDDGRNNIVVLERVAGVVEQRDNLIDVLCEARALVGSEEPRLARPASVRPLQEQHRRVVVTAQGFDEREQHARGTLSRQVACRPLFGR